MVTRGRRDIDSLPTHPTPQHEVAAPQALAKPAAKSGKAKVVKVQSVKKVAASSSILPANLSTLYAQGCQNGTVPDRTMGGDNNNYEYYGDVCTVSVPSPLTLLAARAQTAAAPPAAPASSDENTNYEYYGSASGS